MATPSRSASSRARSGAGSRPATSGGGDSQFIVLGGIAVLVVIVLVVMMGGGDSKSGTGRGPGNDVPAAPEAKTPSTPTPAPVSSSAKSGKTPAKPAPALTAAMLAEARALEAKMKDFYNEGSAARTAGDNQKAREKQASAKEVYDQIEKLLMPALLWQEDADLNDWAQPAEFVELGKLWGSIAKLNKMVRMGGGK